MQIEDSYPKVSIRQTECLFYKTGQNSGGNNNLAHSLSCHEIIIITVELLPQIIGNTINKDKLDSVKSKTSVNFQNKI